MSALKDLDGSARIQFILELAKDRNWRPPSYLFVDEMLNEVQWVNRCTVLDDEDALALFGEYPGAVYVLKKDEAGKHRMLPWKYDSETNEVNPLAS